MVKLTIVTTTYNQERYIRQALDSFLMQKTNFPFEAIVSDDCSTDQTPAILKEYANLYPDKIKPVFNQTNIGAVNNFVRTLSLAQSEYVALCDGDDYWTDEYKLEKQVNFLDTNPEYTICFHQTRIFFEDKRRVDKIYPNILKQDSSLRDLIKENYIPANTVVYRWRFNNGQRLLDVFPKNIIPGDYFIHLLHAEIGKIKLIRETMSSYRRHPGGIWWLSSQSEEEEKLFLKYGRQQINFFKEVQQHFKLDNQAFENRILYLMNKTLKYYLKNEMFQDFITLKNENLELYDKCFSTPDFNLNLSSDYDRLSKPGKVFYLLAFNRKKLKIVFLDVLKRWFSKLY
jgi:glycosyltransferase involved in cell wall biosynthesis